MRPILLIFLLGLMTSLVHGREKPLVVATASMIADMAQNIAGDALEVATIVPIGGDPHLYEPTPSDAQLVASADLVLCNGLTFEGWLNELIAHSGTRAAIVTVTDGIDPIESTTYQNATDPHAWMDASLALTYIANIRAAFVQLDPANSQMFEFNYDLYRQQVAELDQYIREQINTIPEKQRILITSHDAFSYFGKRYGLRLESVLGTSTDADVQTSDIIRLNKVIRENAVPAVFIESTINPKLLEQLAADNNIRIGGKLYADSLGDEESPAASYLDMLRYNTDLIVAALSGSGPGDAGSDTGKPTGRTNTYLYLFLGLILIGGFYYLIKRLGN